MCVLTPLSHLRLALMAFCAIALPLGAHAQQAYPVKPIRIIVGFAPGGGVDNMVRTLSQPMADVLGQPIVVDNKPGGSGNIAASEAARTAPDGYTLLIAPFSQQTVNPFVIQASPNLTQNMIPVAVVGRNKLHLVVRKDLPVNNLNDLLALARSRPGKLTYASSGLATPGHMLGEIFLKQTGVEIVHVPYKGAAPAVQSVLAGETDMTWDPGLAFQHVRVGNAKILAVASERRPTQFPDTPTMAEAGYPNVTFDVWSGIWAPAGTPPAVVDRFSKALSATLARPEVIKRFDEMNAEARFRDASEFRIMLEQETRVLSSLIKERKITLE